jgi:hypothetical protein
MKDELHNEQEIAYAIRRHLEAGTRQIDAITLNKLMLARQAAVERQKIPVAQLQLAGTGAVIERLVLPHLRTMAAFLALAIGATGTYYWSQLVEAEENEAIDSALLADDLPINAYLDHGFKSWVEQPDEVTEPAVEPGSDGLTDSTESSLAPEMTEQATTSPAAEPAETSAAEDSGEPQPPFNTAAASE